MGKKIILLIIVICLIVGGGLCYYFSIYHKTETIVTTVPTSTTATVPTPTCNNSEGNCSGTNMIDCVKNWLVESGCFSQEYVIDHFSNFTISEYPGGHLQGEKMVSFIFSLDNPYGSSINTPEYPYYWWTHALVEEINGKYHIKEYTGPLKKYVLNINKEEAFQKIKNGGCYLKNGDTLDSIKLSANDCFFTMELKIYSHTQTRVYG